MHPRTFELIGDVPLLVDGSDGSLWTARASLADAIRDPVIAGRLLVRVTDFILAIEMLEKNLTPLVSSATVCHEQEHEEETARIPLGSVGPVSGPDGGPVVGVEG